MMLIRNNLAIGIECRFGSDWPGRRCGATDDLDVHSLGKITTIASYHLGFSQECSKITIPR